MKPMSNVDIYTISNELNNLLSGARVDKSFQPTKDIVVMRFHVPGTGRIDYLSFMLAFFNCPFKIIEGFLL